MATLLLAFADTCQRARTGVPVAGGTAFSTSTVSSAKRTRPDFDKEIKPIVQARCMPCHFPGGKVYEKLPFDRPETITRLGTKLFTHIKDEDHRRIIREFLSQP